MRHCMLVAVVLISNAAWASPASNPDADVKPEPSVPLSDENQNSNTYLYGYVMQVAVGTKGTGMTIVAVRTFDTQIAAWQTVPICGKHAADLNPTVGHWTQLAYSRDPSTARRRGYCRELHSANIVK